MAQKITHVYLIRHGQAYWNVVHKMQGQVNIPLTDVGRAQSRAQRDRLAVVPFDLCFTSPLGRARETAAIVLADRGTPVIVEPRLIEQAYGICEGASHDEFFRRESPVYGYLNDPAHYTPAIGGETFDELNDRVAAFIDDTLLPAVADAHDILVAAHGAVLCSLVNTLVGGVPVADFWQRKLPHAGVGTFDIVDGVPDMATLDLDRTAIGA